MAIIPFRENPGHEYARMPATPGHDHMLTGECTADLWWWEPTKTDLAKFRSEYKARIARRIRPGFYVGLEPHDEGRPT